MIFILIIISLSILILAHELGHFWVARFFKIKVEEFGLGLPPRIISKEKNGIIWSLNALPIGGFVKIFGEDGDSRGQQDSFTARPIWQRAVVVSAGVIMNIILGWIILSAIFMVGAEEHLMIANVMSNSPASTANLKSGDLILEAKSSEGYLASIAKSEEFIKFIK